MAFPGTQELAPQCGRVSNSRQEPHARGFYGGHYRGRPAPADVLGRAQERCCRLADLPLALAAGILNQPLTISADADWCQVFDFQGVDGAWPL